MGKCREIGLSVKPPNSNVTGRALEAFSLAKSWALPRPGAGPGAVPSLGGATPAGPPVAPPAEASPEAVWAAAAAAAAACSLAKDTRSDS